MGLPEKKQPYFLAISFKSCTIWPLSEHVLPTLSLGFCNTALLGFLSYLPHLCWVHFSLPPNRKREKKRERERERQTSKPNYRHYLDNILAFSSPYKATPCRLYLLVQFQWSHVDVGLHLYFQPRAITSAPGSAWLSVTHRHLSLAVAEMQLLAFLRKTLLPHLLLHILCCPSSNPIDAQDLQFLLLQLLWITYFLSNPCETIYQDFPLLLAGFSRNFSPCQVPPSLNLLCGGNQIYHHSPFRFNTKGKWPYGIED